MSSDLQTSGIGGYPADAAIVGACAAVCSDIRHDWNAPKTCVIQASMRTMIYQKSLSADDESCMCVYSRSGGKAFLWSYAYDIINPWTWFFLLFLRYIHP